MRLEHVSDANGHPIGVAVPNFVMPPLPDRMTVFHGVGVRLEPLTPAHGEELWAAFSQDTAGHMWAYLAAGPFADATEFSAWFTPFCATDSLFLYAIIDIAYDRAIGFASYLRADPGAGSIEVGWVTFSPQLQRSSLATDAMVVMMREAFAMGYRRYEWKCNALNAPSISAAHRLGFSFEGLFRQALTVKGHNRDTAWFAIIDRDWPPLETAFATWLAPDNFDEQGFQRTRLSDLTAHLVESRWPTLTVTV